MRLLRCKNQNCLPAMRLAQSSTAKQITTIFFIVFPVMSYQEMQQNNTYIVDERDCKCIYIRAATSENRSSGFPTRSDTNRAG